MAGIGNAAIGGDATGVALTGHPPIVSNAFAVAEKDGWRGSSIVCEGRSFDPVGICSAARATLVGAVSIAQIGIKHALLIERQR